MREEGKGIAHQKSDIIRGSGQLASLNAPEEYPQNVGHE